MDKQSIIHRLKTVDFIRDWEGAFSLLGVSISIDGLSDRHKEIFGFHVPNIFLNHRGEITGANLPMDEYENWGKNLAKLAENKEYVEEWVFSANKSYDVLMNFLEKPVSKFLESSSEFLDLYNTFTAYQWATKATYNFTESEEVMLAMEGSRKYCEKFFFVAEDIIKSWISYMYSSKIFSDKNYSKGNISNLFISEIISGTLPDIEVLDKRNECGIYWTNNGILILDRDEFRDVEESWINKNSDLKGESAFPGVVRGVCRVIKDPRKAELIEGEILVAGMTEPSFLPIMKKAGAIVTDVGGLLCHAAIVARELKKTCIIGTKVATKVLKDGDMVEVDADNGIVRIIEDK